MAHPLTPNTLAPDFTLPDGAGRALRLRGLRGRNVVLAFYPGDWTAACTSELSLLQETLDDIRAREAEIMGISCDPPASHRAWAEQLGLTLPLLSDFWPHGDVSRQYGVFRDQNGTSERALVFIDVAGTIREIWVAEDPEIPPGLDVVFEALDRLRRAPRGVIHA
jgi:peroxiredoxin